MDGEAQGKAGHGCMPSRPAACLGLMGSVEPTPFFSCGMVGTTRRAAPVTPSSPSSDLALLVPCFLEPAFPRRCFQHLKPRAKPFLHSRKIFVQGLGTRRRGNQSHFGVEQAACCGLLCLPCQTASALAVSRTGKTNATLQRGWCWGWPGCPLSI